MLKPQLILLLSLVCFSLMAQEKGYLITRTDSASYEIKFQEKSNKTSLFFRKAFQETWHEVYASNAESAGIIGEALYLSLQLPDIDGKVWVKCILDGKYKLVEYKNVFYAVKPEEIIRLDHPEKSDSRSRFLGQMISLFSSEIDFDFRELSYHSKSLVKPFVQYHEEKSLSYYDYNRYAESVSNWSIGAGLSITGYDFYPEKGKASAVRSFDQELGVRWICNVPAISKRLFFSAGVGSSYYTVDNLYSYSFNDQTNYYSIAHKGIRVAAPVLIEYEFLFYKRYSVTLGTGIKASRDLALEQELVTETLSNNVVRTEVGELQISSDVYFQHFNEVLFKVPAWNKLYFGVSYSYLAQKSPPSINLMRASYSYLIFARFIL